MEPVLQAEEPGCVTAPLFTVTATAAVMIKQALSQAGTHTGGLRLAVVGGGCKGFHYRLSLEQATQTDDVVVVQDGIRFLLDPVSAQHLQGTRLDYISTRHGAGFHFFGLDVARTIGCGSPVLLRRCIAGNTRTTGCFNSAKRPLLEISQPVAPRTESKTSVAHPGLRPLSICPTCRYVTCRCDKTA
jgi:iron-sulfur cluster assembly accessory protein